jgi:hypothetical protein
MPGWGTTSRENVMLSSEELALSLPKGAKNLIVRV